MSYWSNWVSIEDAESRKGTYNHLGVYEIRLVTSSGNPMPISRLVGVDPLGILYIGRSGFSPDRSVAYSIGKFAQQRHSGGVAYAKAKEVLDKTPAYLGHSLQVRAQALSTKNEIESAKSRALQEYFSKHGELPPCNSAKSNAGFEKD